MTGSLPRHLVDILAGIFYIYCKEYPQLTNQILQTILIKNEFQPFSTLNPATNQNLPVSSNQSQLSKEQKIAFIDSMKR